MTKCARNVFLFCTILAQPFTSIADTASNDLQRARKAYQTERYRDAFEIYSNLAVNGNPEAQLRLGEMYDHLNAPQLESDVRAYYDQSKQAALKWITKAATQGFAEAQYKLGFIYELGNSPLIPPDESEALKWYLLAAKQGYAAAQFRAAEILAREDGISTINSDAYKWYLKSARQNFVAAQFELCGLYANDYIKPRNNIEGYFWCTIFGQRKGIASEIARDILLKRITARMSAKDIEQANLLVREWVPKNQ